MTYAPTSREDQPVNRVQWLDPSEIDPNDYNPNHVAPPEMRLLKRSIMEDGWTQPVVVRAALPGQSDKPYVLVDGYHRWRTSQDAEVAGMTGGLIPAVVLPIAQDRAHQMMSTIRHNRARGTHHVRGMAHIVGELATELGVEPQDVMARLGMDKEEYGRLLDKGNMLKRHGQGPFNGGWVPG